MVASVRPRPRPLLRCRQAPAVVVTAVPGEMLRPVWGHPGLGQAAVVAVAPLLAVALAALAAPAPVPVPVLVLVLVPVPVPVPVTAQVWSVCRCKPAW